VPRDEVAERAARLGRRLGEDDMGEVHHQIVPPGSGPPHRGHSLPCQNVRPTAHLSDRMFEPREVLVDRDIRARPHLSWRDAWTISRSHDLSTVSAWSYARGAVEHGGLRAVIPPVVAGIVLTAAFIAVGFGAAVLAGEAQGSTKRAAWILVASVVLSQVLTAAQNRRLTRRLFIVANVRVYDTPSGWAIAWVSIPTKTAPHAKGALLGGAFRHVETTYNHNADDAEVAAYYRLAPKYDSSQAEHAESLLADAPERNGRWGAAGSSDAASGFRP
jgi:hypothetical protein